MAIVYRGDQLPCIFKVCMGLLECSKGSESKIGFSNMFPPYQNLWNAVRKLRETSTCWLVQGFLRGQDRKPDFWVPQEGASKSRFYYCDSTICWRAVTQKVEKQSSWIFSSVILKACALSGRIFSSYPLFFRFTSRRGHYFQIYVVITT